MSLKTLAQLLEMVAGLQRDLGLENALPLERDILAAFGTLSEEQKCNVKTEALMEHPLLANVPKASFHRALRALLDRGHIEHVDGYKTGHYRLSQHF